MLIIPDYDFYALSAPQSFRNGVQAAINILDATFVSNMTVKIAVGYGEAGAFGALGNQSQSEGGFLRYTAISYSALRSDLISTSSIDATSASLPNTSSVNGTSIFYISSAQERLFGLLPAVNNTGGDDGQIGIGTRFTGDEVIAAALHEITHALGRTVGSSLDIFRFTSPGNRLFTTNSPATPAYFSLDNGVSDIADFGQQLDPGDFLNSPASTRTPNDPFDEFINSGTTLTAADIGIMNALGFKPINAPPPAAATADMILRHGSDGLYEMLLAGQNTILAGYPLGHVGPAWQFDGRGNFSSAETTDMMLRDSTTGVFEVYDIRNDNITSAAGLGQVGLEWQVAGFGDLNGDGTTDMMLRNGRTGVFESYIINNNVITSATGLGQVGLEWQVAGFGDFNGDGTTDMMLRNSRTGSFESYIVNSNVITSATDLGQVGLEWQVAGFGDFNGDGTTDMMLRNGNTGLFELYDIVNNSITAASAIGQVGLEWRMAGFGPVNGAGASDMVLRNTNTGAFEVYDIANNQLVSAAGLGQVGVDWQFGGFAAVQPNGSPGASGAALDPANTATLLVQAMAGFSSDGAAPDQTPVSQAAPDAASQASLLAPASFQHAG